MATDFVSRALLDEPIIIDYLCDRLETGRDHQEIPPHPGAGESRESNEDLIQRTMARLHILMTDRIWLEGFKRRQFSDQCICPGDAGSNRMKRFEEMIRDPKILEPYVIASVPRIRDSLFERERRRLEDALVEHHLQMIFAPEHD
jgi:hypothetical protein